MKEKGKGSKSWSFCIMILSWYSSTWTSVTDSEVNHTTSEYMSRLLLVTWVLHQ